MCNCNHAVHADVVGSLLRPAALKSARQQFQRGEIDAAQLRSVEDEQIRQAVDKQRQLGWRW
ncbi:5-methyltetrahydropteroyltriglutamate--homocysteine methyltransferase [Serratia rubidaea]|uniref:5-methyltetrahydropteroyltriglutamate--homocysteine methyltransferase n=1 Tax=Serratia rubidaea TaxID=61652 RepID=A0A4U9HCI6_SERRU|nr:5-methyltetrahydropteroyltriglutamate--homocysteine methyltransferase [Serratia rubidaea]